MIRDSGSNVYSTQIGQRFCDPEAGRMKSNKLFLFRYFSVIEVYDRIVRLKIQTEDGKMRENDVAL